MQLIAVHLEEAVRFSINIFYVLIQFSEIDLKLTREWRGDKMGRVERPLSPPTPASLLGPE